MAQKLSYLKAVLWWLGIIRDCPKCRSKLIRINERGWDAYKCSSPNCDFGKKRIHYPIEIWKR
jgi:hypothetical protein